jgi:adenylosuccinate synthase
MMKATVIVGGLYGDEGKGKILSYLALNDEPSAVVRGGVGPNAGHTVVQAEKVYRLRMIPSAFVNPRVRLMVGPGVLIDPQILLDEIGRFDVSDRILIDERCGIIEEIHRSRDKMGHLKDKIGTTGSGTGPANADRILRIGKLARDIDPLSRFLGDVAFEANRLIDEGKKVFVEGSQGTFLSLYHGTYPYVTSKVVTASAACSDVGLGPTKIGDVIIVFKSYVTRVGSGPLSGELSETEIAERGWREIGTVTGRTRRAAPFDLMLSSRACMLNGATQIALTKLDTIFPNCKGINRWQDLIYEARQFIHKIETVTQIPVTLIGTGPGFDEIIDRRTES